MTTTSSPTAPKAKSGRPPLPAGARRSARLSLRTHQDVADKAAQLGTEAVEALIRAAGTTPAQQVQPVAAVPLPESRTPDSSRGLQLLDPARITTSRYSGRHADACTDAAFDDLKRSLAHTGGNLVPVLVRPTTGGGHELFYGLRRLNACRELRLPVLAIVDDRSDLDLVQALVTEAQFGAGAWSPCELGATYAKVLSAGLYPSQRRMAESLGLSFTEAHQCLALLQLPAIVVAAFRSPRDITLAAAKRLSSALRTDPQRTEARARVLAAAPAQKVASAVLAALTAKA